MLGGGANNLFDHQGSGHAAAAGGVERVFNRHIIIGQNGFDLAAAHFAGEIKIHHVALVVFDDEQEACAGIHGFGGGDHLVRRWRSEDLARTGGVEHAVANEASVQRFVTRTAAGDQSDLALGKRFSPHELPLFAQCHNVGMGGGKAIEAFTQNI